MHCCTLEKWLLALVCCVGLAPGSGHTQTLYPQRPVRLIVPFAPGSAADTLSRQIAAELGHSLGQTFVVENKGGAGGTIGTAEIARAKPDGYTLGIATQGTFVNNQALYSDLGYDPVKDFTLISQFANVQNLVVVSDQSSWRSITHLLETIRASAANTIRYSSSGVGTSHHIAGAVLAERLGTPLLHVPYTGAPRGLSAIISGDVDMGFYNLPAALGLVTARRLRPLALTGPNRSALLPEIPTLAESGLPDYSVTLWWGLVAPAGLPADMITCLHVALDRAMAKPALRKQLLAQGFTLPDIPLQSPAAFEQSLRKDIDTWLPLLKQLSAQTN